MGILGAEVNPGVKARLPARVSHAFIYAVLLYSIFLFPFETAAKEASHQTADAKCRLYPVKIGNWWEYTMSSALGKTQFKESVVAVKPAADGTYLIQVDTRGARREAKSRFLTEKAGALYLSSIKYDITPELNNSYSPAKLFVSNAVRPGSIWKWTGKCSRKDLEIEQWQVFPNETVAVKAGKFACVKISSLFRRGTLLVYATRWYAPDVGIVKGTDGNGFQKSSFELTRYHVK